MEKIKEFLQNKKLCDNNFLFYMNNYIEFVNSELIDFCGCYIKDNKLKAKVPQIINDYTRSIVIHELGHIYDYYTTGKLIETEDTSLLWEILYLEYSKNHQLLHDRIKKIEKNINTPYYHSLQKIKKRS